VKKDCPDKVSVEETERPKKANSPSIGLKIVGVEVQ